MQIIKYLTIFFLTLCLFFLAYIKSEPISSNIKNVNFISSNNITDFIKIKKGLEITNAIFFNNDNKIAISNNCCGIIIYSIKNDSIEKVIRNDSIGSALCGGIIESYFNNIAISEDEKYIAIGSCSKFSKAPDEHNYIESNNTIKCYPKHYLIIYGLDNFEQIAKYEFLTSISWPNDTFSMSFNNNKIFLFSTRYNKKSCRIISWDFINNKKLLDLDYFDLSKKFIGCYYEIGLIHLDNLSSKNNDLIKVYLGNSIQIIKLHNNFI